MIIEDDAEYSNEPVVSNDCIVKLSSGIQSMPEVTICIVPNQGRVKQDRKEVKYLPYNAELPQALKGKKVGEKISFKKISYEVLSIE